MKKFNVIDGNYIKDKDNTNKIYNRLLYCLIIMIIFSFYKNGILPVIKGSGKLIDILRITALLVLPSFICLLTHYLYQIIKKDKKYSNYSSILIPGVIISLIMPINTPIYLIIIASIVTSLSKLFIKYLNPSLVGYLIIIMFLKGNNNFESISSLICIISFVYLIIKKAIKWRISVSYVITIFILSIVIDVNISLNLLLFSAIFIATDSPTSPITNYGQIIGGIILGIITIIIRYLTNFYADVVISILIFNVITIAINKLSMRFNLN